MPKSGCAPWAALSPGWRLSRGGASGGYPPQPPKKSKAPLIVTVVAVVVALAALGITGFVAPGFFLSGGSSDGESGQTSSGQSGGGSAKEPVGQKRAAEGTIPSEEDEVPEVAKETRGRFLSEISNGNAAAAKANTSTLRWARVIADRVAGMQHYIVLGRAIVDPERIQTNLTGKLGAQDATGLITLRLPDADGEWCVSEFEFG